MAKPNLNFRKSANSKQGAFKPARKECVIVQAKEPKRGK